MSNDVKVKNEKNKKEKKEVSKEEVRKKQEKIILVTRIVGVSFFVIGLLIIFITAIIRGRSVEPKEDVIIFESSAESIALYPEDKNILEDEYLVLNNIDEFNNFINHIDEWYNESLSNYSVVVSEYDNLDDVRKQELIDKYKTLNDGRYKKLKQLIGDTEINENTFSKNAVIVVEDITSHMVLQDYTLNDICLNEGKLNIYINKDVVGVVGDITSSLYFIELDKSYVENNIVINVSTDNNSEPGVDYKPIIYIYPEMEMDVNVRLGYSNLLTVSYPKYESGWDVHALKDGTLIDKDTNRELYALYYESINKLDFKVEEDGFVVRGDDSASFLEDKLSILGLNSKEKNEFIIYWLPILESNKYNYIRFASMNEINENMPLDIEPKPDSVIRVLMTFKGLENEIKIDEQVLTPVVRNGYSVVEWGGTIIK